MKRILALLVLLLMAVPILAWAESIIWGSTLEASPTDADLAANIDNFIRETRTAVRERADTELAWDDTGGDTTQTGRLRPGAARAFYQDAAPAALTVSDSDGANTLDDGRLWFESDPEAAASVTTCCAKGYVRDQTASIGGAGAKFVQMIGVPTGGIILWDSATGDENCDGNFVADQCPCGFAEATEFRGLFPRGTDVAAADVIIPDDPGVSCSGAGAPAGCGAGAASNYDDVIDTAELPAHTHDIVGLEQADYSSGGQDATTFEATNTGAADPDEVTASTGGAAAHTHPFRTVLFCRAR